MTDRPNNTKPTPRSRISTKGWNCFAVGCLMLVAFALRLGVVSKFSHELVIDVDAYLQIAGNIATGEGFSSTDSSHPTAFRPPLYPMLLAVMMWLKAGSWGVAIVNIICGCVTVWATWRIGNNLRLGNWSLLAAMLVAIDPLLLRYASKLMTETFFTMLVTLLFLVMMSPANSSASSSKYRQLSIGILFGLTALCRPTIWAFAGLLFVAWLAKRFWEWKQQGIEWQSLRASVPAWMLLGVVLVVSPWVIRNAVVMRSPVLMTTHGGYTLLMGNNPHFWNDVVKQPWGTTWSADELSRWQKDVGNIMQLEPHPPIGEVAISKWMTNRAISHIKSNPKDFSLACWFRLRRFWNIQPQGTAATQVPRYLVMLVQLFYIGLFLLLIVGGVGLFRNREWQWMPLLLLILSLSIVHTIYWSNARMRIPLVPAISLVAIYGLMHLMGRVRLQTYQITKRFTK